MRAQQHWGAGGKIMLTVGRPGGRSCEFPGTASVGVVVGVVVGVAVGFGMGFPPVGWKAHTKALVGYQGR